MYAFRPLMLCLGLLLCKVAGAEPKVSALVQDLVTVQQRIGEAQAELQTQLRGYNQVTIHDVGAQLRELKRRRDEIVRALAAARDQQRQHEAAALLRPRPELAHRLEVIKPQVDQAATAFDEQQTPGRGARLRDLSIEEIDLRDNLATADSAAKDGEKKDQADKASGPAIGTRP